MNKNELEIMASDAKRSATATIERLFGVKEKMIVKVKPQRSMRGPGRKSWMGCYRSNTILSAHGIPVIWIADNINEQAIEFGVEDRLSDIIIDTTELTVHTLRDVVKDRFAEQGNAHDDCGHIQH